MVPGELAHCSAAVVPGMHGTCGAHTFMQANSHTQKIKLNFKKRITTNEELTDHLLILETRAKSD